MTARISGYCPARKMTDKAIRITVESVDGEFVNASTTWLPRSICSDLALVEKAEDDGTRYLAVSATVPAWWVRKLDTRTAWEARGMAGPPHATQPR